MPDINKKKRKAMSIRDTANLPTITDDMLDRGPRRSGYQGPRKSSGANTVSRNSNMSSTSSNRSSGASFGGLNMHVNKPSRQARADGGYQKSSGGYAVPARIGGLTEYAWIVYIAVLAFCLMITLIIAGRGMSNGKGYYIPKGMLTSYGILNTIYDDYQSGKLTAKVPKSDGNDGADVTNAEGEIGDTSAEGELDAASEGTEAGTVQGTVGNTGAPNSMTGATMALDDGSAYGEYPIVATHEELIAQLSTALETNDYGFIGRKLSYPDENSGQLMGYPQSVIEYFTYYMSLNADKRANFISEISKEEYGTDYNGAKIIKLPLLKFTVNMGYDNTKIAITGFADQVLNAGQSATVAPLLPCMYTITVTTPGGTQSSQVEANMNEGNLQINIGVTDKGAQ